MKGLVERIEELLHMQERLINLLLLSHRARVSTNTAFDLLYYNVELLDLISQLLASSETEDYPVDYSLSLALEALSWIGVVLPTIESACPIFLEGVGPREPLQRIGLILGGLEETYRTGGHHRMMQIAQELRDFSNFLKYQIVLARRAYANLA
ncbi:MAG: hypothetical protein NZ560_03450 [Aquificaceae bacterium]|nr:hypothetical protein [Aquificaceae bacterium]MDW8096748.1 hypothetical protein [Aquificaceae bacterium]